MGGSAGITEGNGHMGDRRVGLTSALSLFLFGCFRFMGRTGAPLAMDVFATDFLLAADFRLISFHATKFRRLASLTAFSLLLFDCFSLVERAGVFSPRAFSRPVFAS
jgi:hypothetical protein